MTKPRRLGFDRHPQPNACRAPQDSDAFLMRFRLLLTSYFLPSLGFMVCHPEFTWAYRRLFSQSLQYLWQDSLNLKS